MWNMALPWLCLQLYDHYRYDRDDSFLKETLYPAMRETALFLKSTFTRTETGLCNIPSTSPENMYLDRKGVARAVCTMCAMDIGISREFALAYADVCGVRGEADEAARWKQFSQDVRDYAVMANGELREWDAPAFFDAVRHLSRRKLARQSLYGCRAEIAPAAAGERQRADGMERVLGGADRRALR